MSQRLQLKMLLDDITRDATRTELCLLLATLLSWTSVVRALVGDLGPGEAAPERPSPMPQRKDSPCDEDYELEDDVGL